MKTSEIRDLIDFISKSGLNEVNIETKELKLSVKREPDQKVFKSPPAITLLSAYTNRCTWSKRWQRSLLRNQSSRLRLHPAKKTVEIKSPMIGTFYRSANPDTPAIRFGG